MPCNRSFATAFLGLGLLRASNYSLDHLVLTEFTKKSQKKRNYLGREPVKRVASPVFMYTIRYPRNKVGNRRLPAGVLILFSSLLADIGRLYCHVSADVLGCRSLVARHHFNIKRLILLGVIR